MVITTGGTGFTGRDVTPEALEPLFRKAYGRVFRGLPPHFLRQDRHLDDPVSRHRRGDERDLCLRPARLARRLGRDALGRDSEAAARLTATCPAISWRSCRRLDEHLRRGKGKAGDLLMPDKTSDGTVLLSGDNSADRQRVSGTPPCRPISPRCPRWKSDVGRRIDADLSRATIPRVSKAVKWNTPCYGVEDGVWFLAFTALRNTSK